jgi:Mrp family chromosome partitioning ATPase
VPAQAVADAGIVNRVADTTIYVVREGKVDRRFLPELERMYREKKFKHLSILLNDAHINKKQYGYGYGNYSYGYGYGYGEAKKKKKS